MSGETEITTFRRCRRWAFMEKISRSGLNKVKTKTEGSRRHWGSFCRSTSIHGMRYLVEPSRSLLERLWWFGVVIFGFYTASYYVSLQYVKWSQTNIEANNLDVHEDIMNIPFPAFTICDNRKIVFSVNETVDEVKHQNLLYMLCGDDRITESNYTIEDFIKWSSPLKLECQLLSDQEDVSTDCRSMVVRTLTDQGICYTFNMLDPKEIFKDNVSTSHEHHGRPTDWDLETGYLPNTPTVDEIGVQSLDTGPFPKRGRHSVLLTIFHSNDTIPAYCSAMSDGFKFTLHSPHELPMVGLRQSPWIPLKVDKETIGKYTDIPAHSSILVDVRARKIVAGDNLKMYNDLQRKCYFPEERELAYFKTYSYNSCHLECLTNLTLELCDCKDIYMPTWDQQNIKICTGDASVRCIHQVFDYWDKNRHECKCLPTCTTLQYTSKTWSDSRPMINESEDEGLLKTKIAIYSTDPNYVKSERRAVYCFVDFIADCGGVFGLFCGMSIVSFLELLYYSVLWLITKKKSVQSK